MHKWETRMLLRHYLERGVSKAELSRRFGVSRRTIHEWIQTGQLDRDLSTGGSRYSPRPPTPHKLDPYTAIIDSRLEQYPGLSAQRLFDEVRAAELRRWLHACAGLRPERCVPARRPRRWCGLRRLQGVRARWTLRPSACPGAGGTPWWWC